MSSGSPIDPCHWSSQCFPFVGQVIPPSRFPGRAVIRSEARHWVAFLDKPGMALHMGKHGLPRLPAQSGRIVSLACLPGNIP